MNRATSFELGHFPAVPSYRAHEESQTKDEHKQKKSSRTRRVPTGKAVRRGKALQAGCVCTGTQASGNRAPGIKRRRRRLRVVLLCRGAACLCLLSMQSLRVHYRIRRDVVEKKKKENPSRARQPASRGIGYDRGGWLAAPRRRWLQRQPT